ncbi:MAG: FAD-dependent monooxygenase [Archangium sp.]|nr:FAD-dependent monooxygenase [Archangium sp.]
MGGGPAGLTFSLLMKKTFPSIDIEVFEKNKPDDTFGWGVVFSKETLGNLRDADGPMLDAIESRFAYWDDIETYVRGQKTVSTGHGFCGLARKELLELLQKRCVDLGVKLHFGREVSYDEVKSADLVIGCDGVHSPLREKYADVFKPTIDWRKCKFTWLGTTQKLNAFTFHFKESPFGLFQVHAYPFTKDGAQMQPSGARSTFIVECREDVWKKAGLDTKSEAESVAFLEELFKTELAGERLLPNKSIWRTFPTITCERWRHGNLVLMGDAVHTAHFSIGSGTKLAMEDAIALFEAMKANANDVNAALTAYEKARKPETIRVQRAAQTSLEWFENAARYVEQPPVQFTFNLMTRSKRITWDNLRTRDPKLVARNDDELATRAKAKRNSDGSAPPPLFAPFQLRGLTLENRVVVSPMCQYSAQDGVPNDWHLVHLGSRALGGAGLVMTEMTDVSPEGRITYGCAGLWNDAQAAGWKRVIDFVKKSSSSAIGVQLAHAGRKASWSLPWEGDTWLRPDQQPWQTLGPSAIPYHKVLDGREPGKDDCHVPREMDTADLARIKQCFVEAAKRANACGFDFIELHAAHGYLLSTFLSPLTNQRSDGYGGSVEKRMRYPLEVFEAVRVVWPKDKPLGIRVSASDWLGSSGQTVEDTVLFARELKALGCDVIDVSSAGNVPQSKVEYGRMYQVPFAEAVKVGAQIPVMAVGGILGADHANTIIAAGRADLCAMAREHLSDPFLTHRHAQAERVDTVKWPKQYLTVRPRR